MGGKNVKNDDIFDAFSYLGMAVNMFSEAPTPEEINEEEWQDEYADDVDLGICISTGY